MIALLRSRQIGFAGVLASVVGIGADALSAELVLDNTQHGIAISDSGVKETNHENVSGPIANLSTRRPPSPRKSRTRSTRSFGDFVELGEAYDFGGEWAQKTHDISAYAGQHVCLAFRYEGSDAHDWFIDDILVTSLAQIHINESFTDETFPPEGWTAYQLGNAPQRQWARTLTSNTEPAAAWNRFSSADHHDDNWLVTRRFRLGPNPQLSYYDRMRWFSWYGYSGVWISTGNCNPNDAIFSDRFEQ